MRIKLYSKTKDMKKGKKKPIMFFSWMELKKIINKKNEGKFVVYSWKELEKFIKDTMPIYSTEKNRKLFNEKLLKKGIVVKIDDIKIYKKGEPLLK